MSAKEVTSFGSISERELVIVSAVADVLQPEESGKSGVSLSLESGRRVWRMRKSGVVFRFRGDYAEGSGSCVIPTRMLDEARHIVAVNPQAELTLRDGVVSVGFGAHRVSMTAGSDLEEDRRRRVQGDSASPPRQRVLLVDDDNAAPNDGR